MGIESLKKVYIYIYTHIYICECVTVHFAKQQKPILHQLYSNKIDLKNKIKLT